MKIKESFIFGESLYNPVFVLVTEKQGKKYITKMGTLDSRTMRTDNSFKPVAENESKVKALIAHKETKAKIKKDIKEVLSRGK